MSTNQPRKPAGTPAGGQWAPTAHAEAEDVELSSEKATDVSDKLRGKLDAPDNWWRQHVVVTKVAGRQLKKNDS